MAEEDEFGLPLRFQAFIIQQEYLSLHAYRQVHCPVGNGLPAHVEVWVSANHGMALLMKSKKPARNKLPGGQIRLNPAKVPQHAINGGSRKKTIQGSFSIRQRIRDPRELQGTGKRLCRCFH